MVAVVVLIIGNNMDMAIILYTNYRVVWNHPKQITHLLFNQRGCADTSPLSKHQLEAPLAPRPLPTLSPTQSCSCVSINPLTL